MHLPVPGGGGDVPIVSLFYGFPTAVHAVRVHLYGGECVHVSCCNFLLLLSLCR